MADPSTYRPRPLPFHPLYHPPCPFRYPSCSPCLYHPAECPLPCPRVADPSSYRPRPARSRRPGGLPVPRQDGRVIYVGKAKSLRPRLSSYFQDIHALHPRTATMVRTGASVEWTVVATEVEALQLEYSWIKEFDPRFNVKYRDDKSYPFLAVTARRGVPAAAGDARREAQGRPLLRAVRPRLGDPRDPRPAAAGLPGAHLLAPACSSAPARSAGPACSATSTSARRRASAGSTPRSTGRSSRTSATSWPARPTRSCERLEREMQRGVRRARLRAGGPAARRPRRARRALEKQAVVLADGTDADVVALAEDQLEAAVQVFHVRGGRVRGQRGWVVEKVEDVTPADLVEHLLQQVYGERGRAATTGPARGAGARRCRADAEALADWLSRPARQPGRPPGAAARRQAGADGDRRAATPSRRWPCTSWRGPATSPRAARRCRRSRTRSGCDEAPLRIECFDVSTSRAPTRGVDGRLRGRPGPQERVPPVHRHAGDATGRRTTSRAIHEVLTRRFRRYLDERDEIAEVELTGDRADGRCPAASTPRPAGRASSPTRRTWSSSTAARRRSTPPRAALDELGIDDVAVCGLAKRLEEVWLPARSTR